MQNITGYTKVYGIIADPIRHSISPLMHNTAFGALGIDGVYVAFETPEEQFDAGVRGLKALGIQGFNVSMPYKRRIMDYLDEISPAARLAGAVNTVVREGDRYVGYLTDGTGFLQALATEGIDIAGKKLVILMGVLADKDVEDMLELLSPIAEAVVTVRPDSPRAMGAEELAAQVRRRGIPACACESVEEGMRIAAMAAGQGGAVCALGSLYLAADVRRAAEAL